MAQYQVGSWRTPTLVVTPFDESTEATLEIVSPEGTDPNVVTSEDDTPEVGSQTWTGTPYQIDATGEWVERWVVGPGPGAGIRELVFEVLPAAVTRAGDVTPLCSMLQAAKRAGRVLDDLPEDELERLQGYLSDASALIRDEAGRTWLDEDGDLEAVPFRIQSICAWVTARAFLNPEGLLQRSIGDSAKMYTASKREGGEAVYLTENELRTVQKLGGHSSFTSMTLVSPYSGTDAVDLLGS